MRETGERERYRRGRVKQPARERHKEREREEDFWPFLHSSYINLGVDLDTWLSAMRQYS